MSNGLFRVPTPVNEPTLAYAPGSPERATLKTALQRLASERIDIPLVIAGKEIRTGKTRQQSMPHKHHHVLATCQEADAAQVSRAIDAAMAVRRQWAETPFHDRAAIFLKAADLLSTRVRATVNAATMLGQSKTVFQAEIDAACELIDFLRFNVYFAERILADQPLPGPQVWNRMDYRPLDGFVFAVSPFNFTAIGGNLPTAPALLGNTVVWKPAGTATLSAYYTMRLLQEAGLPEGVINLVFGPGQEIGDAALTSRDLAGIHFTGSTPVFQSMWKTVGRNIETYRNYPRIVGETGGKDFIVAHPTASAEEVATAIVRGSFEYQGQKCSAASRVYAPANLWPELKERLVEQVGGLKMGDVADFSNFMGAVIDANALKTQRDAIEEAKKHAKSKVLVGGGVDDTEGYFVEPTVIETADPNFRLLRDELFGPVVTTYVYPEGKWDDTLELIDRTAPYGLTGAIFADDRQALIDAEDKLRYAAGNLYLNDKPTGAVVAQQPSPKKKIGKKTSIWGRGEEPPRWGGGGGGRPRRPPPAGGGLGGARAR